MNDKPYKNEAWLRERYPGLTQAQLAEEAGCARDTIYRWLKHFGIEGPPNGKIQGDAERAAKLGLSCEQLQDDYDLVGSIREVAKLHHVRASVIATAMRRCKTHRSEGVKPQSGDMRYRNSDWLQGQLDKGLGKQDIAIKCGVGRTTIARWIARLPKRDLGQMFTIYTSPTGGAPFYCGAVVTRKQAENGPNGMRLLSRGRCYEVRGGEVRDAPEFRRITEV